jgi:hypothetical protein
MNATEPANLIDRIDPRSICRQFGLSEPSQWLLDLNLGSSELLRRLIASQHYADAIRFLAYALPKPHAVWWAAVCLWQAYRPIPEQAVERALQHALRWLVEPTDANRRACEPPDRAEALATPAGCLAYAVYYSDGSMVAPDLPPVMPPPTLTHRLVAGCVMLAAAHRWSVGASSFERLHLEALACGQAIATGELPLPALPGPGPQAAVPVGVADAAANPLPEESA